MRNGSTISIASTMPAFSYTTVVNTVANIIANDATVRLPAVGVANGAAPPRVICTGDIPPFSLFEPVFVQFGFSALLMIYEWVERFYIRTTCEPCLAMPAAPTEHWSGTTDAVVISTTPRLTTHHDGRRVAEKRFAIVTTTTGGRLLLQQLIS